MLHENSTHFSSGTSGDQILQDSSMMELVEFTNVSKETIRLSAECFWQTVLIFNGLERLQIMHDDLLQIGNVTDLSCNLEY